LINKRLYFLVTNSLHQDQRLHRIGESLSRANYDIILVGVSSSLVDFKSEFYTTATIKPFFKRGFLFYLEVNIRFLVYLWSKRFDGVVANDLDTLLAAKLVSVIKRKKLFVDLHEYFTEVPELENRVIKKAIWSKIGSLGISSSSHNYTVNKSLTEVLSKKYKSHFNTIYNFPTLRESSKLSVSNKSFDIVYVGMVNKGRGIAEAILAIKDVQDVTLTIYGDGDLFGEIKELITSHNLSDKIFLKGFIEGKDIHHILASYDLGINLLKPSSLNYFYSSANKYFDYIMAGVPSLSMKFPEYEKLNQEYETSVLIDTMDVMLIKATILKIKSDRELTTRLKLNCDSAKKVYNWKSQESKLLHIYDSAFNP